MKNRFSGFRVATMAALALAALELGGCGPQSVASLRKHPHTTYSIEVPRDYRTVYDRIALRARQHYVFSGRAKVQPGVSAETFPETRSASVTLWDSGGIGIRYRLNAAIRAIDEDRTQVELYAAGKRDRQEAALWITWAGTPLSGAPEAP